MNNVLNISKILYPDFADDSKYFMFFFFEKVTASSLVTSLLSKSILFPTKTILFLVISSFSSIEFIQYSTRSKLLLSSTENTITNPSDIRIVFLEKLLYLSCPAVSNILNV